MTQYRELRAENPGVLILFRIGNFYEAWFEEAELLARELGLKLSSRPSGGTAPPVPQVGFAVHALDDYLTRLLRRGYRVAVVEEGESPGEAGVRERAVARTRTPGTVTADALLPDDRANYLAAVTCDRGRAGLAWTDVSTAGKISLRRQVAILTLLAQAGSYLPARAATIGLVDGIYTRLGSADDLAHGQATFFVEMLETAQILRHATHRSLCLFDELGRGTSTFDGMAIAYAVLEHLATGPARPRTILATHYHELAGIAEQLPQVGAYRMAVREDPDGVTFRYRLDPGGADRSYGLAVARMAGLPGAVLGRAEAVTRALEPVTREGQRALRRAFQEFR